MLGKIKDFFKANKKRILGILALLLAVLLVSIVTMLLLFAFDIIYYEDGIRFNLEHFNLFKNTWYGWIVIIAIQVVLTILLCFIPAFSMAFIILIQTLFDQPINAFLISLTAVMLSSLIMYLMGRFGGYKLCERILGEKDCAEASELLNKKGVIFFPLMMMFPIFPDDALVMVAGTLRMSLKWFVPSIVIGRGIGVATIIFGLGGIPFEKFSTPWHWIIFILLCAIALAAVFFGAIKLNKYIQAKSEDKK